MKTLNLNRNIRILRKHKGVNQDTLAAAMGVSMQAVSKWESGLSSPDIALLPQLAEYFEVDINDLLLKDFSEEEMEQPSKEANAQGVAEAPSKEANAQGAAEEPSKEANAQESAARRNSSAFSILTIDKYPGWVYYADNIDTRMGYFDIRQQRNASGF